MLNCPIYAVIRHWSFGFQYTHINLYLDREAAEQFAVYLETHEGKVDGEVITVVEVGV